MSRSPQRRKEMIICWSHHEGAFEFLKESTLLREYVYCVITTSLPVAIHTTLNKVPKTVLLYTGNAKEESLVEEFLIKMMERDPERKARVVLVSDRPVKFASGVRPDSELRYDPLAIAREIIRGLTSSNLAAEPAPLEPSPPALVSVPAPPTGPSLTRRRLPHVGVSAIIKDLSPQHRDELAIALGELNRGEAAKFDPLEHACDYLRRKHNLAVAILQGSSLRLYSPARTMALEAASAPPGGKGFVPPGHPLFALLQGGELGSAIHYVWAMDIGACVLSWPVSGTTGDHAFAEVLVYTLLRIARTTTLRRKAG